MVGARTVAADPEPADNLATGIERDAAAKRDDPAGNLADRRNARVSLKTGLNGFELFSP